MKLFLCATLLVVHFGFVATCCAQSNGSSFISTIVAESSRSCLDIDDGSSRVGLGLDQWTCGGMSNQSFKFSAVAGGYYTIQPQNDNLCLDAGSGSQTTGMQIVQNTCSGSSPQQWKLNANSDGSFRITTTSGAGCLDIFDGSSANGAIVETYACHSTSNENFVLSGYQPIANQSFSKGSSPVSTSSAGSSGGSSFASTIVAQSSGSCLDINGGSSRVGLGLDQWTCGGLSNRSFKFTAVGSGYYTIQPQNNNLCLDAGSGSQTTGMQIVQNTCSGSSPQQWKLNANSDGSFRITTTNGAGCFDVFDGSSANGAIVETYACHATSNEDFVISGFQSTSVPTPTAQAPPPSPSNPTAPGTPSAPTVPSTPSAPTESANPSAPMIFNVSSNTRPGDIVSIQGTNFDSTSQVWLGGINATSATQLTMTNRWGAEWIGAQIPQSWTGAMVLWVTNSAGASNSVKLNGAIPFNLDALELVPGGAFRVLGRNLLMSGYTPSVTVDGQAATVNLSASTENMLLVTAPESISTTSNATIMVDNGVGIGAAQLDRTIAVVLGSGDPFSLGVGWGGEFTFYGQTVTVNTPCNGSQDDSVNIQNAINSVPGSGGIVVLPAGNCVLANTLTMKSSIVLQGAGKDVTVLSYKSNYPIYAENFNLVGLRNFTLVNANSTVEGLIWKNNTRSFFENIKVETGVSHQLYLTGNQNFIVIGSDFIQGESVGSQNPYLFTDCSGFVFGGNTSTSVDGSPTFKSVHDALIVNNHFTRNAVNQYESVIITSHQFVMDFAFRIAIIANTFDVINGPITNTLRNDGETLLTEGGGGQRTENLGTVGSATSNTITDPNNTINVNPFGTGLPENYGVAIVNGTGTGQTREVIGYSNSTMQVDHPWNVVPDSTSRYATFVWGLEKAVIESNSLIDNPRGIWLYQTAVRDVDISWNTITNGGGIYVRTWESRPNSQFDADYNVRISNNAISNTDGIWMSYINAVFVNSDQLNFGTADTGIEIRNNTLTANNPNVTSSTEDYANREGFMNVMRSGTYGGGQLTGTPMLLGTIFQTNQCGNCSTAFVIGTGDYGTILSNNQPSPGSQNFLADSQILGSGSPGSIGTVIQ